jgi:hypothetical protein
MAKREHNEMASDLRDKRRYALMAWVDLTSKETGAVRRGYITNVSLEGAGLYYLGMVEAGQDVTLSLHMRGTGSMEIIESASGRVIWEDQWGGITIMGVKFHQPLSDNAPTILDRMARANGHKGPPPHVS